MNLREPYIAKPSIVSTFLAGALALAMASYNSESVAECATAAPPNSVVCPYTEVSYSNGRISSIRIKVKTPSVSTWDCRWVCGEGQPLKICGYSATIKPSILSFTKSSTPPTAWDKNSTHTSDPMIILGGPHSCDGDNLTESQSYSINTNSINDVGTYNYNFSGKVGICPNTNNPAYCNSFNPDFQTVDYSHPFSIEVWNDAPQLKTKPTPPSGTPKTGDTLHFAAECKDPDGGQASGVWSVDPPRDKNKLIPSGNGVDLALKNKADAGQWTVRVQCVDDEGELKDFGNDGKVTFDVHFANHPPVINVDPPGPITIDVLKDIFLQAGPEKDLDDEKITWLWDIKAPGTKSTKVPNLTQSTIQFTTKKEDIGDWSFTVVGTDESGEKSDPVTVNVLVNNLAPTLKLKKSQDKIKVGPSGSSSFTVEIDPSGSSDPDGGALTFKYDIIQAPEANPTHIQEGDWTPNTTFTYPNATAGVWIIRVTAQDDEPPEYRKTSEPKEFVVLVDAPPEAKISGPTEEVIQLQPGGSLVLDGTESKDPDSPCPNEPQRCHDTLNNIPVNMSISDPPIIAQYRWSLVEAPPKYADKYPRGDADEIFGVPQEGRLNLGFDKLGPGDWVFSLAVKDHENNDSLQEEAVKTVTIVEPQSAPVAVIIPPMPMRYLTAVDGTCCFLWNDVSSSTPVTIRLDGSMSFDPDNFPNGLPLPPHTDERGINGYLWKQVLWPSGCSNSYLLEGKNDKLDLFTEGTKVPDGCMGAWGTQLTVTDDDQPQKNTNSATALTIIENCPDPLWLCIDFPKHATPAKVEFSKDTDIVIFFHLNAALYNANAFANGSFAQLEVFREEDLNVTPVYKTPDANLLPTNQGGFLQFHWNGQVANAIKPQPGNYRICITILDSSLNPVSGAQVCELSAIQIAVLDTKILSNSDRYIDVDELENGNRQITFNYEVTGGTPPDELHWRVFDSNGNNVYEGIVPSPLVTPTGNIVWDGRIAGTTLTAGNYSLKLEALRYGSSLGESEPYNFAIYRLALAASAPSSGAAGGLSLFVNTDDDDMNNVADVNQSPAAVGEDDLVSIDLGVSPSLQGTLVLASSSMPAPFKVWSDADKTSEIALPKTYNLPTDTVPSKIFVEGTAAVMATFTATLTPTDATALPASNLSIGSVEMSTLIDTDGIFTNGPDAPTLFVRPGLWDFAFRTTADAFGGAGSLFNEQDAPSILTSGNPENFVGRDTRAFYLQIKDPAHNANPAVAEEIQVEWFTVKADSTDDDHPSINSMSLMETGIDTGIFVSPALMLVSDQPDVKAGTNTGLTSHPGISVYNSDNHRTRYVSSIDAKMIMRYNSLTSGYPSFEMRIPLFNRNPDERRTMRIHVFNFSDSAHSISPTLTNTINAQVEAIKERYAPAGVRVEVIYDPTKDDINLPAGSTVALNAVQGGFMAGTTYDTWTPSSDELALINLVRLKEPVQADNENTINVLYIAGFSVANKLGQSFPDGFLPPNSKARNFVFVHGQAPAFTFVAAHEIGHLLTNQTLTSNQANGIDPGWAGGGHFIGDKTPGSFNIGTFNLMDPITVPTMFNETDRKRLWDNNSINPVPQITRLRSSRFVKQ